MAERLIFHVDVNSAFLSWESARRVRNGEDDLRLVPSAIGGDREVRHGVILAKSIPAKKYGIKTGEPITDALRKCPSLILAPPDHKLYHECSRAFIKVCKKYAPVVEQVSVDECYLDMSGTARIYPDPLEIAKTIKNEIRDTLGFTVNVGIGSNKLLAKMASDFEKPDKIHTLYAHEIADKMWPLSVRDLFTVGRATADRLVSVGITTIGALAHTSPDTLRSLLGNKAGEHIFRFANGIDDAPVLAVAEEAKGYSNSTTLPEDVVTTEEAHRVLLALSDSVTSRMRRDGCRATCVSVTIRGNDFHDRSHQKKLDTPTDITSEVFAIAKKLFAELWDHRTPLRLLGLSLTQLTREDAEQLTLFPDERKEREQEIDKIVDGIRSRFGNGTIVRGSVMPQGKKKKSPHEDT